MRVIVGVHDSMAGLRALRVAVGEARRRGGSLHAVRAWMAPVGWGAVGQLAWRRQIAAAALVTLQRVFDDAFGGVPPDIPVVLVTGEGPPGQVLSRYAGHDDDLIVLGTERPGRLGRLSRMTRPSIGRYCLAHAGCPVLVIPPDSFARAAARRGAGRELHRTLAGLTGDD